MERSVGGWVNDQLKPTYLSSFARESFLYTTRRIQLALRAAESRLGEAELES